MKSSLHGLCIYFFSGRKTRSMHHLASMHILRQQRLRAQVLLQSLLRVTASFVQQQIIVTFPTPHKSRYTPWKTMPGFCSSPARMLLSTYPTLLCNLPCSYFHQRSLGALEKNCGNTQRWMLVAAFQYLIMIIFFQQNTRFLKLNICFYQASWNAQQGRYFTHTSLLFSSLHTRN